MTLVFDSPRHDWILQDPKNVAHVSDLKGAQARAIQVCLCLKCGEPYIESIDTLIIDFLRTQN